MVHTVNKKEIYLTLSDIKRSCKHKGKITLMKIQTDSKETNITLRNVKYDYWNNNLMTRLNSLGTHQKESANWNVYLGD